MNIQANLLAVILGVLSGVLSVELTDWSEWLADKLARWSARHHYKNHALASVRAEEQARYIADRPGKLLKLIVALGFAAKAIATQREFSIRPPVLPGWQPPVLVFEFQGTPYRRTHAIVWAERSSEMQQAWYSLEDAIRVALPGKPFRGDTWRGLRRLQKITGDMRWDAVTANMRKLQNPFDHLTQHRPVYGGHYVPFSFEEIRVLTPDGATVAAYLDAVCAVHEDIRRLADWSRYE